MKKQESKTLLIPVLIVLSVIAVKYYQRHKPAPYDTHRKSHLEQTMTPKKEDLSRKEILKSLGVEEENSISGTNESNNNSGKTSGPQQEEFHAPSFDEFLHPERYPKPHPYSPDVNPSQTNTPSIQSGSTSNGIDANDYTAEYESEEYIVRMYFETLTVAETREMRGGYWRGAWESDVPSESFYRNDMIKAKSRMKSIRSKALREGVHIEKSPYEDCEGYYSTATRSLLD